MDLREEIKSKSSRKQLYGEGIGEKDRIGKIQFKDNLDRETPFKVVNIKKRGKITADSFKLTQISSQPLPISAEKKKDLMDMMQLIDEPFREFYLNIKTTNCAPTDPDLDVDNPDIEDP